MKNICKLLLRVVTEFHAHAITLPFLIYTHNPASMGLAQDFNYVSDLERTTVFNDATIVDWP